MYQGRVDIAKIVLYLILGYLESWEEGLSREREGTIIGFDVEVGIVLSLLLPCERGVCSGVDDRI